MQQKGAVPEATECVTHLEAPSSHSPAALTWVTGEQGRGAGRSLPRPPSQAMACPKIEAVIKKKHRMGECPVWEEESGQLVYVDITAKSVCRWDPVSGEVQTVRLRDRVGCVALRRKGSYVVACGTRLGLLDWETQQVQWVARVDQDKPGNRFNDGKVDPAGRHHAGAVHPGGVGAGPGLPVHTLR